MTIDELKQLIKNGECETLDFKECFDKEAIETAGAFSNSKGGTILIGVTDKGIIKGIQIGKETTNDWVNQIAQASNPRIIPDIDVVTIDGKKIIDIVIKECPIKPVAVKGKCFRRVNNSNRLMTPQEIAHMHYNSLEMSWDMTPAKGYSLKDIDEKLVHVYRNTANTTGRRKIPKTETVHQILNKLELVYNDTPTWASLLLFGKRPMRYMQQAVIHCGRFKNETLVIDDDMIEGSLTDQIEQAMDFIKKNIRLKFVMTGEPRRKSIWDYPLDAIREALVNAVCHRDYLVSSTISVRIFDDRLEIWNPGSLFPGVKVEDLYKPHDSHIRNKGIAKVFFDIEFVERWGSGIGKMINLCEGAGVPVPAIKERQQGFHITFSQDIYTEEYLQKLGLNDRQKSAIKYIKENKEINLSIFKELHKEVSEKTLYRDLIGLVEKGLTKESGTTKGRKYLLK
ncbi:MAG: hypothetical protein A2252_06340 [Elusimicrobia bacterium RIFOXYA2_FULL_39_19]|nr:MAG: hypothetical protein A2252_06340 [Elusimicrobia bacterium RIFOXYA2_FULL_39_19]